MLLRGIAVLALFSLVALAVISGSLIEPKENGAPKRPVVSSD